MEKCTSGKCKKNNPPVYYTGILADAMKGIKVPDFSNRKKKTFHEQMLGIPENEVKTF